MISNSLIENTINAALSTGGDFAEIFMERTKKSNISMINGRVEKALSGIDYGVGIRIFNGNNAIYTYTNNTTEENLIKTAKEAASSIKNTTLQRCSNLINQNNESLHKIKVMPEDIAKREKVDIMRSASDEAFKYHTSISQTRSSYMDTNQEVLIANSEGVLVEDRRVRTRFAIEAIAANETEKQSGYFNPGGQVGFELFEAIDVKDIAREAARIAVTMLNAALCPSKKMPVVIDNGFGGVIFHEACGHSLEATSVAKNASVFAGRFGEKIANEVVTAIDDGTIPNGWGSSNFDDEGTPCQKNILIENGILKSYLIDKLNGRRMGMGSTGSGRRESYRYAPTSRMSNTYIASGKSSTKEIIESVDFGLYAKQMGGGSVDPATGVFNFAVLEGYIIRNGKICEPVRGATLIGKGSDVLMKIDMVSNNLERAQGMCGSISGSIPTDVGQPMIRVSEMVVGGRS